MDHNPLKAWLMAQVAEHGSADLIALIGARDSSSFDQIVEGLAKRDGLTTEGVILRSAEELQRVLQPNEADLFSGAYDAKH